MMKRLMLVAAVVVASAGMSQSVLAHGHKEKPSKVTICHRTNSAKNAYRQITVSVRAVDGEGRNDHSHHEGPVFDPSVHNQQNRGWGDIIPPVEGVTEGLNWTAEGQAIYNNDCEYVQPQKPGVPKKPEVPKKPVTPTKPETPVAPQAPGVTLGDRTQVVTPVGGVKAGGGAGSIAASLFGLGSSLVALGYGALRLRKND